MAYLACRAAGRTPSSCREGVEHHPHQSRAQQPHTAEEKGDLLSGRLLRQSVTVCETQSRRLSLAGGPTVQEPVPSRRWLAPLLGTGGDQEEEEEP